jgi:hypothetical protein
MLPLIKRLPLLLGRVWSGPKSSGPPRPYNFLSGDSLNFRDSIFFQCQNKQNLFSLFIFLRQELDGTLGRNRDPSWWVANSLNVENKEKGRCVCCV